MPSLSSFSMSMLSSIFEANACEVKTPHKDETNVCEIKTPHKDDHNACNDVAPLDLAVVSCNVDAAVGSWVVAHKLAPAETRSTVSESSDSDLPGFRTKPGSENSPAFS